MKKETTELTLPQRAAVALGTAEHEKALAALVEKSVSIVEIKNTAGRDQCHSAMMALKDARVGIQKAGKAAREDATQFSKAVIEEEKRLVGITEGEEQRLKEIRDAWDEAREAEKRAKAEAEAKRVAQIREAIEDFRRAPSFCPSMVSVEIDEHADDLARAPIELDFFMELAGEAEAVRDASVTALREMAEKARAREAEEKRIAAERQAEQERIAAERAELARLRAEQEERERVAAAVRAEQEAKDRAVREAEEAERREAMRKADEVMRAERAAHEARIAAERAEITRQQDEVAAARRVAEFEAMKKEVAARLAEAQAKKDAAEKAEAERRDREAKDTALRNAAPLMYAALLLVRQSPEFPLMDSETSTAVDEAIDEATTLDIPF